MFVFIIIYYIYYCWLCWYVFLHGCVCLWVLPAADSWSYIRTHRMVFIFHLQWVYGILFLFLGRVYILYFMKRSISPEEPTSHAGVNDKRGVGLLLELLQVFLAASVIVASLIPADTLAVSLDYCLVFNFSRNLMLVQSFSLYLLVFFW